jgi:hypothetical protein
MLSNLPYGYGTELLFLGSMLVPVMTKAILSSGIFITAN